MAKVSQIKHPALKWFFSLSKEEKLKYFPTKLIDFDKIKDLYAKQN